MRYQLKDKKLHETLDQISNGDFSKRLNEEKQTLGILWFGKNLKFALDLEFVEIEKSFDPNEWNEYSQITPPEFIPLILKEVWNNCIVKYYAVIYKDGKFYMTDYEGSERCLELGVAKYFVKELPK